MGRKKATSLKKDTKQLLEQHIDAATTPAASLFAVDTRPAPQSAASLKKQRAAAGAGAGVAGAKRKRDGAAAAASSAAAEDDAMDTDAGSSAAAPGLFEDDSDDEPTGTVTRTKFQRTAHKQGPTVLVPEKETRRLKRADATRAEAEAAVRARPEVFDVWATDREADLKAAIHPPTNAKGFRVGRLQQRGFRHPGAANATAHVQASVLPTKIHDGVSFNPDKEKHQEMLRTAYDKDEAERAEQAALRARFTAAPSMSEEDAAAAAAEAAQHDDSWMDEPADSASGSKNPASSSTKFSKSKRNQMARAAANVAKQQAAAEEKSLAKLVNRLPVMVAELKKAAKLRAKEKARIEALKQSQPDRKPKLGKYAEEELFPEVALTDELPEAGALRNVKPSFNVIKEQFNRFQERHLIETRKKVKAHKGFKNKLYDRYKDEPAPTAPTLQKPTPK